MNLSHHNTKASSDSSHMCCCWCKKMHPECISYNKTLMVMLRFTEWTLCVWCRRANNMTARRGVSWFECKICIFSRKYACLWCYEWLNGWYLSWMKIYVAAVIRSHQSWAERQKRFWWTYFVWLFDIWALKFLWHTACEIWFWFSLHSVVFIFF